MRDAPLQKGESPLRICSLSKEEFQISKDAKFSPGIQVAILLKYQNTCKPRFQASRCPVPISIVTQKTPSSKTQDAFLQVFISSFCPSDEMLLGVLTFLIIWGQAPSLSIWVQQRLA